VSAPGRDLTGQYFVTKMSGAGGVLIGIGERLLGDNGDYQHAGLCVGDQVIEAMPGGAILTPLSYYTDRPPGSTIWSDLPLGVTEADAVASAGLALKDTPYFWGDYFSLALEQLHIRPAWVKRRVATSTSMICSQLVDRAYANAGFHLFADGRDPGDVTPGDLYTLITESRQAA
jgi:hypothetical protein